MKFAFPVLLAAVVLCPLYSGAQSEAKASASVTIVAPVTLSRNNDLRIRHRSEPEIRSVSVSRQGSRAHATGMLPATSSYRISGSPDACYSVSVSPLVTVKHGDATINLRIQACMESGNSYLPENGADLIYVSTAGSTVSQAGNDAASAASDFQLTVNYN